MFWLGVFLAALVRQVTSAPRAVVKCALLDRESPGWDIKTVEDVNNDATCQILCQQSDTCKYFEYNYLKFKCKFKLEGAANILNKVGVITGPKYCAAEDGDYGLDCETYGRCAECSAFDCTQCDDDHYYDPSQARCLSCNLIKNCKPGSCGHSGCDECAGSYLKVPYQGVKLCRVPEAFLSTGPEAVEPNVCEGQLDWRGVNLAGAEFGDSNPGIYGETYVYPVDVAGNTPMAYWIAAGMNTFRIPFRWERVQPTLYGSLSTKELSRLKAQVEAVMAASDDSRVILDMHNYGRYCLKELNPDCKFIIGENRKIPRDTLGDVWVKLMQHFEEYGTRVVIGLMNEPHDQSIAAWIKTAQAAITAIRGARIQSHVLLPGGNFTNAPVWMATENKDLVQTVEDPLQRTFIDIHLYLDKYAAGKFAECAHEDIGYWRLRPVTSWLRVNKLKGVLTEFGASSGFKCLNALHRTLTYLEFNADVWKGWTYWAGGPWWYDYMYSVEPDEGGNKHKEQMRILMAHMCPSGAKESALDLPGAATEASSPE